MAGRTATAGELTTLRKNGQYSQLYIACLPAATVYAARVNQTFSSNDEIAEITYDSGSGTLADVQPGMSMYVGSSAGAYDVGIVRIRKTPTGTVFYIGETSEIAWADDLYLTVVASFDPWQKHIKLNGTTPYIDYDVAYSDQHSNWAPIPCMMPDAVAWLDPDTGEADVGFSALEAWNALGDLLTFSWSCATAAAIDNAAAVAPTFTFDVEGRHLVACTMTTPAGKTSTGYRDVYIYSANNYPMVGQVGRCTGNWGVGGWNFQVTLYDNADLASIRDREKVILFAIDYYDKQPQSLGPITGRENIVAMGWISGETIRWAPGASSVTFEVQGPHWWLNQQTSFPTGIVDDSLPSAAAFNGWLKASNLTLKKAMSSLILYRSTIAQITDVIVSDDTRLIGGAETPKATLWQQMLAHSQAILAQPCADRYGKLYIQENVQFQETPRAVPEIMTITTSDWREEINIQRSIVNDTGDVFVAGVLFLGGGNATPICARAYGNVPAHHGAQSDGSITTVALIDSDHAARVAGRLMAAKNNPYKSIPIPLAANNRMIDVAPQQFVHLPVSDTDTARGIEIASSVNLIPRQVSYRYEASTGIFLCDIDVEAETFGTHAIITACPEQPDVPSDTTGGDDPTYADQPVSPPVEVGGLIQNCVVLGSNAVYPINVGDVGNSAQGITSEITELIQSLTGDVEPLSLISSDDKVYYQIYLAVTGGYACSVNWYDIATAAASGVAFSDGITPAIDKRNPFAIPEEGYAIVSYRLVSGGTIYVDLLDLDGGTKTTLFSYEQDPTTFGDPWRERPDYILVAQDSSGQAKLLVFNLEYTNDGTGNIFTLQCRILDRGISGWAAGSPTLLQEVFATGGYVGGAQPWPYAPPVVMGGKVYLTYSVEWDDDLQLQPFFIVDLDEDTLTEYDYSYPAHEAFSQIYDFQPYHSLDRAYFVMLYPDPLNYEALGYIASDGTIAIVQSDDGQNRNLIADQVKAYVVIDGLLTNSRMVYDASTLAYKAGFTASRASLGPSDGLSAFVDDGEQRVWFFKHSSASLDSYQFTSLDYKSLDTDLTITDDDFVFVSLQGDKFIILQRRTLLSDKFVKLYIIRQDPGA